MLKSGAVTLAINTALWRALLYYLIKHIFALQYIRQDFIFSFKSL